MQHVPHRDSCLYLHNIIYIRLRVLIAAYFAFLTIVAIAVIVGIVKNPHHNDITKYVANVTKTSQMKQLACGRRGETARFPNLAMAS
jgi:hypothetical protein